MEFGRRSAPGFGSGSRSSRKEKVSIHGPIRYLRIYSGSNLVHATPVEPNDSFSLRHSYPSSTALCGYYGSVTPSAWTIMIPRACKRCVNAAKKEIQRASRRSISVDTRLLPSGQVVIRISQRQWLVPSRSQEGLWHLVTFSPQPDSDRRALWECSCPVFRRQDAISCQHILDVLATKDVVTTKDEQKRPGTGALAGALRGHVPPGPSDRITATSSRTNL